MRQTFFSGRDRAVAGVTGHGRVAVRLRGGLSRWLGDTGDGPRRTAAFRRLWAVANLLLLAATWRLWVPQNAFPQVPLIGTAGDLPSPLQWALFVAMVVSLAAVWLLGDRREQPGRTLLIVYAAALIGLMAVDQHRLQPWAYQSLIIAIVLATGAPMQVLRMLRLLAISIYAYSAAGKLDYQFLHTVGQQFLQTAAAPLGIDVQDGAPGAQVAVAAVFPIVELLIAIALAVPSLRPIGAWGAVALHAALLVMLGPLGMQHQPGVLVWNAFFIAQAVVLFTSVGRLRGEQRGAPQPGAPQDGAPQGDRRRGGLAWTVLALAVAMPLAERYGYWDHWLSWSLYSPHSSRVDLEVHASAAARLPSAIRPFLQPDLDDDGWQKLDLARWSISAVGVPIYPQARFQLGVALAVADTAQLDRDIRVRLRGVSDRWRGARETALLQGRFRIRQAADGFWLGALPRA